MAVDQTTSDGVTIKILYSKLLTGCPDGSAKLKVEDGVLKGRFGNGVPVELTREL